MSIQHILKLEQFIQQDDHIAIKELIKRHPDCINGAGSPSSIWLCVQYGQRNALKALLELGADPMLAHRGIMPIYIAASYGNVEIIQILGQYMSVNGIAADDDAKAIDAAILYNRTDCIKYLLQQIPSKEELETLANKYAGYYQSMILNEGRRRARLGAIRNIMVHQTQTSSQTELILPADVHPPIGNMIPLK